MLSAAQGKTWPTLLARWARGRLDEPALLQQADTKGKQAEANFYLGLARQRAGDATQAQALWRKVVQTEMLGYFEYEMATVYLSKKGPPIAPPPRRATPPRPPKNPPVPDGSI